MFKSQTSVPRLVLDIGIWQFIGVWSLDLGISATVCVAVG